LGIPYTLLLSGSEKKACGTKKSVKNLITYPDHLRVVDTPLIILFISIGDYWSLAKAYVHVVYTVHNHASLQWLGALLNVSGHAIDRQI
jgi:hypothetical protein